MSKLQSPDDWTRYQSLSILTCPIRSMSRAKRNWNTADDHVRRDEHWEYVSGIRSARTASRQFTARFWLDSTDPISPKDPRRTICHCIIWHNSDT